MQFSRFFAAQMHSNRPTLFWNTANCVHFKVFTSYFQRLKLKRSKVLQSPNTFRQKTGEDKLNAFKGFFSFRACLPQAALTKYGFCHVLVFVISIYGNFYQEKLFPIASAAKTHILIFDWTYCLLQSSQLTSGHCEVTCIFCWNQIFKTRMNK